MKIYTKSGDKGETGLFGGERVSKSSLRIEVYGTIDELNSFIGLAVIEVSDKSVKKLLLKIQDFLFVVGSDLAAPRDDKVAKLHIKRTPATFAKNIEKAIDLYDSKTVSLRNFILPGGSKGAALLHICRTISRRAERRVVALNDTVNVSENIIMFLNRLSDLFFVLARYENSCRNVLDIKWNN